MHIKRIAALIILMVMIVVAAPISYVMTRPSENKDEEPNLQLIELWQIDGFEGGKGSRANFLSNTAKECFKGQNIYFEITSLSADAARANIADGRVPDIISYNAGFYGIEQIVNEKYGYTTWCSGGYCLITLDSSSDFSDVTAENTVINEGKDNLTEICALVAGLSGADRESSVNAYLKLLDGSYKYLLGTQRDIYRFISRKTEYYVKPLSGFNDLYQNISVLTTDKDKCATAKNFIDYLTANNNVSALGLFSNNTEYSDNQAMREMMNANYVLKLNSYCSQDYINELLNAAKSGDLNKIKNLLK